jgi:hypothetical protein
MVVTVEQRGGRYLRTRFLEYACYEEEEVEELGVLRGLQTRPSCFGGE